MPGSTTAAGVAHHDQSTTGLTLLHGELPFGYLKASVATGTVSLFVLPFNFPRLWPLLGNGFSCVCCVCECVRCVHEYCMESCHLCILKQALPQAVSLYAV